MGLSVMSVLLLLSLRHNFIGADVAFEGVSPPSLMLDKLGFSLVIKIAGTASVEWISST